MRKIVVFASLLSLSAVQGMQNNFVEGNARQSEKFVAMENLSLSDSCKTWTTREWIVKIISMPRNKEDFNAPQNSNRQTILMCATKHADCKIMQQVLNAKDSQSNVLADINALDKYGNTALSIAAELGDIEKVDLLLKNGADIELANKKFSKKMEKKFKNFLKQLDKEFYTLNCNQLNSEGFTQLMIECVNAGRTGNTEKVKRWLDQPGIDVNLQTDERYKQGKSECVGYTALRWAVEVGCKEAVELLLNHPNVKNKIDVNISDAEGITPLMRAVFNGDREIAELLLNHSGIDVNVQDNEGCTALICSVLGGCEEAIKRQLLLSSSNMDRGKMIRRNKEITELLLNHSGIDVNIRDKKGKTALIWAVEVGCNEAVELLLNHPNVKDKIAVNLEYDCEDRPLEISEMPDKMLKMIISSRKLLSSLRCRVRGTALTLAAAEGHEEVVKLLLDRPEIDVNACFPDFALANAVWSGHREIVKLLLDHPKINVDFAKYLVTNAIKNGRTDIVELLRNHPKSKNVMSLSSKVFSLAVSFDEEVIKYILDNGGDVNEKDLFGYTMLMYAAEAGNVRVVRLLLDQPNIDINIQNNDGETALDCAERAGRRGIRRLMLSKTGQNLPRNPFIEKIKTASIDEIREQFFGAVSRGDIDQMDSLLYEKLVDVNAKNKFGDNALIIVADKGNLEIVRLLFEYGADLSLKDAHGDNALIRAAKKGYFDVVEELLFRKANINSVGQHKETALMAAAENGQLRVVKLLLKKGAKVSVKNDYNKTALDIVNEKIKKLGNINNNYESIKNILEKQNKQLNLPFGKESQNLLNKWEVITDDNFTKDLKDWKKNDPSVCDKVKILADNIKLDPFRGLGRVERLAGDLKGLYSRRINKQNRLVYEVDGEKVILKSCKGHYEKEKRNRTRTNSEK